MSDPTPDLVAALRGEVDYFRTYQPGFGETVGHLEKAIDRIEELEGLVRDLDISIMHPDMGGHHQCTVRANGRKLTPGQWSIIHSTEDDSCRTD